MAITTPWARLFHPLNNLHWANRDAFFYPVQVLTNSLWASVSAAGEMFLEFGDVKWLFQHLMWSRTAKPSSGSVSSNSLMAPPGQLPTSNTRILATFAFAFWYFRSTHKSHPPPNFTFLRAAMMSSNFTMSIFCLLTHLRRSWSSVETLCSYPETPFSLLNNFSCFCTSCQEGRLHAWSDIPSPGCSATALE